MDKTFRVVSNIIFCIQVLLVFLLFVEDRINLPSILQVAGRMHPLVLHIPIGALILVLVLVLLQNKLDEAYSRQVIGVGLLLTSFFASLAALFGFFLSLQGDYGGAALLQHKVSGVILSWLCYLLVVLHQSGWRRPVFFALGGGVMIVLVVAGHTGSILTHGENFLLEPLSGPPVALTADNASAYDFAIAPIFERKCFGCHNQSKAKGKLVMTDLNSFKAGGEHGKPWVEGKPEESRMVKAFYLPLEHDEHMPPDGKPQLTSLEIATVKAWIRSGANFTQKLDQYPKDDSLRIMVGALLVTGPGEEADKIYSFAPASDEVIEKVNTPFVSVMPLYQNSPALQADFYVKKAFDIKSLEALKSVADQLVVLSLSKMPVSDKDLSIVAGLKNLEVLNLNFTSIQGEGLKALEALSNLRVLSLSGTAVRSDGLTPVLKLPNLTEVFLWSTAVTEAQADSLKKHYPSVQIYLSQFKDESVLKLSKPMLVNDGVISPGEEVILRHPMNGVKIRYTLDGTVPDSTHGSIYEHPLKFDEATVIKSVGCKDGWYCSEPMEVICFVKGKVPDHVELINQPDPQYSGEGVQSLTDGRKGVADVLREQSWLGYRKIPFSVLFSFDNKPPVISRLVLSYARNVGGYSLPPKEVEVWAGEARDKLKLIRKITPEQPSENGRAKVDMLSIPLENASYPYYKVIATQVPKLPSWHDGKGERSWVFIDEMFLY